jgi:hypothetical protein
MNEGEYLTLGGRPFRDYKIWTRIYVESRGSELKSSNRAASISSIQIRGFRVNPRLISCLSNYRFQATFQHFHHAPHIKFFFLGKQ